MNRDYSLGLSVPGVMDLRAFRQEAFTTALPATRESGTAAFGAHARAKTVLAFPGAFRALESAFHKPGRCRSSESGYSRDMPRFVNAAGIGVSERGSWRKRIATSRTFWNNGAT